MKQCGTEHIYKDMTELIGHTPLVEVCHISELLALKARVLVKVELFNPGGSVKDRAALGMILNAEREGKITPGATIIEPTSGNTGVGLAWVSVLKGYKLVLTMPENMSEERMKLLKALGATLELTPVSEGMAGAIKRAEEIRNATPGSIIMQQFSNPSNPQAHTVTTAEEIWTDTNGHVDIFVAGVGSGGTVSGTGRGLKRHNPGVQVVAVEPDSSPLLSGGSAGAHGIQGIGANFIPENYDPELVDEVVRVTDEEAFAAQRMLSAKEGILAGISSGAALHAAVTLALREENRGKTIVALLPDTGERYLSIL